MKLLAILLRGPASVGKSTVAIELRKKIGNAALFNVDMFVHMWGGNSRIKEERYFSYDNCILLARRFAERNYNLIIDDLLVFPTQISYIAEALKAMSYNVRVFTLIAPLDTLIQRDKERPKLKHVGKKEVIAIHTLFNKHNICKPDQNQIDTSKLSIRQIVNKILRAVND